MALFKNRRERDHELTIAGENAKLHAARSMAETARIEKRKNELEREQRDWMRMNPGKPISEFPVEIMNKYKDLF